MHRRAVQYKPGQNRNFGFFLLALLLSAPFQSAYAAQNPEFIESPVYVPEVLTFFNRELQTILSYTAGSHRTDDELFTFEWYSSVVYEFDALDSHSSDLNFLGGIHFRVGDFRIPFFITTTAENINRKAEGNNGFTSNYLGLFGGSGLIYDNPWFSLGTFAGYYDTRENVKYDSLKLTDNSQKSFSFTVIPILYTSEILYLNILKDIIAKLNATQLGINDITLNLRFRPFSLFGGLYDFSLYYQRESYVSLAKNNIYGVKLSTDFTNYYKDFYVKLSLEGGYRDFYDIKYDRYVSYEDTLFIKAQTDITWKGSENAAGFRFSLQFDKLNTPKIGAYMVYRLDGKQTYNGISGGEFGKLFGASFKVFQEMADV